MQEILETQDTMLVSVRKEIHALSQPVTAVLCMLELARMHNDEIHMREGIESALTECVRMARSLQRLRFILDGPVTDGAL